MSIDQSLIYAKRFETDPTPLKQAVLGTSPQGLDIDPYTALRALQHIDQSRQMQMAQAAQQAPMANAQPSIADDVLAKTFGTGGIVAFAHGGVPRFDGEEGSLVSDEDAFFRSSERGDDLEGAGTAEDGVKPLIGEGDPDTIKKGIYALRNRPSVKFGDRAEETKALAKLYAEAGGPDIYTPELERLKAREGEGLKAKDQGLGLSLLKASAAMAQGNNLGRAVAGAAGAFGEAYHDVLKEQRAEQEHRDAMRFHLADAQRKDRLGQFSLAANATHQARMEALAAQNAEDKRLALEVQLQALSNRGAKAGSQISPTNLVFNAREEYRLNPTPENAAKVKNAEASVEKTKTTFGTVMTGYVGGEQPKGDIEKNKADVAKAAQEGVAIKDAEAEVEKLTGFKNTTLDRLKRTDPAAANAEIARLRTEAYKKRNVLHRLPNASTGGGGTTPALPSGYNLDQ